MPAVAWLFAFERTFEMDDFISSIRHTDTQVNYSMRNGKCVSVCFYDVAVGIGRPEPFVRILAIFFFIFFSFLYFFIL